MEQSVEKYTPLVYRWKSSGILNPTVSGPCTAKVSAMSCSAMCPLFPTPTPTIDVTAALACSATDHMQDENSQFSVSHIARRGM